jgi:hypothetical protein
MNNLKTYQQYYSVNEEFEFKQLLKKLRVLGLAALVTLVGCSTDFSYRGKGVVIAVEKQSNVVTPKTITVETASGDIKLTINNSSSPDREPFSVQKGDTLYLDIRQSASLDGYISKVDPNSSSTEILKIKKLPPRQDSNW